MFSKIMRQGHMYVALFLTPWMLMYALSTVGMNHHDLFRNFYNGEISKFVVERELPYTRTFNKSDSLTFVGREIVKDLGLDGGHSAHLGKDGKIVVHRSHPISPRRITYDPARKTVLVEKEVFRTMNFLTRLHTRVGYSARYGINSAWAASVDLSVLATFFWIFSGFWLWWELKRTRRFGALFSVAGLALFGLFVFVN